MRERSSGKINGESCTIAPDTGKTIIVPGHLVFESQLIDEFERIRGVTAHAHGSGR